MASTWMKISEAVIYIRTHFGIYMDVQRFNKLRLAGHFECKTFPGQPIRVNRHSIDEAYAGLEANVAEAEPEEVA